MAHHLAIKFRNQGKDQGIGGPQRIDDEVLRLVAMGMIFKRRAGDLGYCDNIRIFLISDNHFNSNN